MQRHIISSHCVQSLYRNIKKIILELYYVCHKQKEKKHNQKMYSFDKHNEKNISLVHCYGYCYFKCLFEPQQYLFSIIP